MRYVSGEHGIGNVKFVQVPVQVGLVYNAKIFSTQ